MFSDYRSTSSPTGLSSGPAACGNVTVSCYLPGSRHLQHTCMVSSSWASVMSTLEAKIAKVRFSNYVMNKAN